MRSLFFSLGCSPFQRHSAVLVLKFFLFCVKLGQVLKTLLAKKQIMLQLIFFCLVRKIQVQLTVIWIMPEKKCLVLICTKKYHKSQELPVKGVFKNRLRMEISVLGLLLSKFLALQKVNMNQQYKQYTINVHSPWPSLIGVTFCQILLISVINCHFQRRKTYSFSLQISVFLFLVFLLYLAKNLRLSFSNFF